MAGVHNASHPASSQAALGWPGGPATRPTCWQKRITMPFMMTWGAVQWSGHTW